MQKYQGWKSSTYFNKEAVKQKQDAHPALKYLIILKTSSKNQLKGSKEAVRKQLFHL